MRFCVTILRQIRSLSSKIGDQVTGSVFTGGIRKMKDPSLEQLATIDDRDDEGVDVCCDLSPEIKGIGATISPSTRRHQLIPGRQSPRWIGRHSPIASDVCETIPEETSAGSATAENDSTENQARQQQIAATHPPPRRHKLLPIQHLSLNIRQVSQVN